MPDGKILTFQKEVLKLQVMKALKGNTSKEVITLEKNYPTFLWVVKDLPIKKNLMRNMMDTFLLVKQKVVVHQAIKKYRISCRKYRCSTNCTP